MTEVIERSSAPTSQTEPEAPQGDRTPELGRIRISDAVVAKIAAVAASELPHVGGPAQGLARIPGGEKLGTGAADLHGRPKATAHVDDGTAYLELVVSIRWPAAVPQVSATLREHVRERVRQLTSIHVGEVRVSVADLITDTGPVARVH